MEQVLSFLCHHNRCCFSQLGRSALVFVVVFFVLAILHSISCALDRRQQSENEKAREREPHMRAGAL